MSKRLTAPVLKLLLAVSLMLGTTACGDNPVGDDHEDHPVGLALVNAQGQNVVTITPGPTVNGQIAVAVNGTQTYTVYALSEDGDRLELNGQDLAVNIATQPQNATLALQGANRLVVTGRTAGTGTARLELMHEGHAELGGNVGVVVQ